MFLTKLFANNQIDYNFGEAPYKKEFGTMCILESGCLIYSKSFKLMIIHLLRLIVGLISSIILYFLRALKLELKIKKILRYSGLKK